MFKGVSRISRTGDTHRRGINIFFGQLFRKNYMKMKQKDPQNTHSSVHPKSTNKQFDKYVLTKLKPSV